MLRESSLTQDTSTCFLKKSQTSLLAQSLFKDKQEDVEGYSDDDIETIFDGDPSAYWNID